MRHPTEETLVAYCSGDAPPDEAASVEDHLATCAACRAVCAETSRLFAAMAQVRVPERDADYGARVWQALEPKLGSATFSDRWAKPGTHKDQSWYLRAKPSWLVAAALLLAALGSFLVGRWTAPEKISSEAISVVNDRILLAVIADHLDRSGRTLVEIANADPSGSVFPAEEEKRVRELLAVNRLLRQSAGERDPVLRTVLDDLERTLIEIAHASGGTADNELGAIQQRLETRGLLFKMRIASAQARDRALGTRRPERQTI